MEQRRRTASKFFPVYQPAFNFESRIGSLPSDFTFSRASTATYFDSTGTLRAAAANEPRFNYNPLLSAIPRFLVEAEARTNSLRNNSMTGAVAGSPGTAPTSWSMTGTGGVITRTIVGIGTLGVMPYIDLRYQFSGAGTAFLTMEQSNQVAATVGQTWTLSHFVSLIAGSMTNVSALGSIVSEYDAGAGFLVNSTSNFVPTATLTRREFARTNSNALCAFVAPGLYITVTDVADITLRIGIPQMELGAFASSPIVTVNAAVTRAADICAVTGGNFGKWFNPWTGTFAVKAVTPAGIGSVSQAIIEADLGDTNNRHVLFRSPSGLAQAQTGTNAVVQADITLGAWANTTIARQAYSYAPGNFNAAFAGVSGTPDNEGTPPQCSQLILGNTAAANRPWMGEFEWVRYWQQDADPKMVQYLTSSIYD